MPDYKEAHAAAVGTVGQPSTGGDQAATAKVGNRDPMHDGAIDASHPVEPLSQQQQHADHQAHSGRGSKIAGYAVRLAANVQHLGNSAAEAVRSKIGSIDAIDTLINQHRETESYLSRIKSVSDPVSRRRLLESMCDGLTAHMHIEEEIFYPAAQEAGQQQQIHVEDHTEVKELMTELLKMTASGSVFDAKLAALKAILEKHIQEEEHDFFPAVRKALDRKRLHELGQEMHKRHAELMSKHHPRDAAFEDVEKPVPPTCHAANILP